MKYVYIVSQSSEASNYGVGTYYNQILDFFNLNNDFVVSFIDLFSATNEITIRSENGINRILIPKITLGIQVDNLVDKYFINVSRLLKYLINDSSNVFFLFNHTHHHLLIKEIKNCFHSSQLIFTIHYLSWVWELKGNEAEFKNLNKHFSILF